LTVSPFTDIATGDGATPGNRRDRTSKVSNSFSWSSVRMAANWTIWSNAVFVPVVSVS